jgi:hypothetical protein
VPELRLRGTAQPSSKLSGEALGWVTLFNHGTIRYRMKRFRAYLAQDYQALLVRQPAAFPFRLTVRLKKWRPAPASSGQGIPAKALVSPRSADEYHYAGWQRRGTSILHAVIAELCFAADVAELLLHPLSALREELMSAGMAELPTLNQLVSATTLLGDYAEYHALVAADPTRPLSTAKRAKLLNWPKRVARRRRR